MVCNGTTKRPSEKGLLTTGPNLRMVAAGHVKKKNQATYELEHRRNTFQIGSQTRFQGNCYSPQLNYQQRMHKPAQHCDDHPKQMQQCLSGDIHI